MNDLEIYLSRLTAWEFCKSMLPDFYKKREFLHVIADTYQYLAEGEKCDPAVIERLEKSKYVKKFVHFPENAFAAFPPRAGKSITITLCNAWSIGKYPEESILRLTHSQRLFNKFSRAVRSFITHPKFIETFPGVELSKNNQEVAGWSVKQSKQLAFFGSGVGGGIVGEGASFIAITDDLYKSHNEAQSQAINDSTLEFMESAFDSRKEKDCKQFDVGTRWTKKDYMGQRMENDDYDIIIQVPALNEKGKSFCEDVKSTKEYNNKKKNLERTGREHIWYAEYQQEPIDVKGILFPKSELKRFRKKDLNMDNIIGKITFIDTADKGEDFYSAPIGYIFPPKDEDKKFDVYIPRVIYTKRSFKFTQPLQIEIINQEEIDYTFIETNKEGSLYVNNVQKGVSPYKVRGLLSKGNKETRILVNAEYIFDFYFLEDDDQDEMYKAFFEALTSYLKEKPDQEDDAPDSLSGLAIAIRSMFKHLIDKKQNKTKENEQNNPNK